LSNPVTVHCSWVQIAVKAVKESWPVCATRNAPSEFCTSAALPTLARGDAESIVSETWLLATVEVAVGSCGAAPPDGPAGLLSPQPLRMDPTAATDAAWHA
jgi:hypothetical protein